ncbi:MAG: protein translocase subunit SecD [Anaerolineae bacterium]
MRERNTALLVGIAILAIVIIWIDLPDNPGIHIHWGFINIDRDIRVHQGLDLQGGLQVLLEADVPEGTEIDSEAIDTAKVIVENRVNGLGVTEPLVQKRGERRIIVELPGIEDPELAIATIQETGLLEFIDAGYTFLAPGTKVETDYLAGGEEATPVETPTVEETPAGEGAPEAEPTSPAEPAPVVYHTVIAGAGLKDAGVTVVQDAGSTLPVVAFELKPEAASAFAEHTASHIGQYLAIVLDKTIVSCPVIEDAIPDGRGIIRGRFTPAEARSLSVKLRYGALPVPLRIETTRTVGPTLGQDSVRKSITAGAIGLSVVFLFMLVYYRVPGFLADLALAIYALLNFAIYKFGLPPLFGYVTLTLPGIAGFLLSTGMAVDANILIFERMKEELRAGRSLGGAIEAGFNRAWTSIRDSNISTIITCAILFYFGSTFGASMVKGFALTLIIGVTTSMFTAVTVTRTFIRFAFDAFGGGLRDKRWLLGI